MNRDLTAKDDPFLVFNTWFQKAVKEEPKDANAMSVATVDEAGMPNVRIVYLKDHDPRGFTFFTNLTSDKGQEAITAGKAAANFYWMTQGRQVRIRGTIEQVSEAEADRYFQSRARTSRLGAWASEQSRPLESRETLLARVEELGNQYPQDVPRPPHWSGLRIVPTSIEFWQDGEFRLHDRFIFMRDAVGDAWRVERRNP